jgi:hypothetical protein
MSRRQSLKPLDQRTVHSSGSQLSFRLSRNPSRVMWPVAERNLEEVAKELELSLKEVEQLLERLLR